MRLATEYCLPVTADKKIGILGNAVATPLIQQLYKHILQKGGHPIPHIRVDSLTELLYTYGNKKQIEFALPFDKFFMKTIDGIINIQAETNLKRLSGVPPAKIKQRTASQKEIIKIYMQHVKPGELAIIPYPTEAFAQDARARSKTQPKDESDSPIPESTWEER